MFTHAKLNKLDGQTNINEYRVTPHLTLQNIIWKSKQKFELNTGYLI